MKKLILLVFLLSCTYYGFSQDTENKKEYLPIKGEWALGVDLDPFFKWTGQALGNQNFNGDLGSVGYNPYFSNKLSIKPQVSIFGKYMYKDKLAFYANVGILHDSRTDKEYVNNDEQLALDPLYEGKLIDMKESRQTGISIGIGAELRKGTRRIQGILGGGLLYGFSNNYTNFSYGNAISEINQTPSISTFGQHDANGNRILSTYNENPTNYFGANVYVGVEYFIIPKLSIGGQVNLTMYGAIGSDTFSEVERYNQVLDKVERKIIKLSPGLSAMHFGTENFGGKIYFSFYF